ncbi:hypothetical protein SISSUDRAFT_1067147 [Sistotremastrum suecicum HHB10207 ss-3]|uniref:Uncharacterized protein n=1 Tax=Sistotremastrum suecicum HHB10207 ss-3 TaxID=1314776 RepID=A0A165XG86_9AGAM|nr:hypothetical protein SISSUDRAFT_1067147 [Sistotremastrum suecicum HHB10207 ss-3]
MSNHQPPPTHSSEASNTNIEHNIGMTPQGHPPTIQSPNGQPQIQYGFVQNPGATPEFGRNPTSYVPYPTTYPPSHLNYQMANQGPHPQYYGPPAYAQQQPSQSLPPAQVQHPIVNALSAFDQMFGATPSSTIDIRSTRGTFVLLHANCDICTRYAQHLTGLQLSTDNYTTDNWRYLMDHLQRAFPGLEQYAIRTASQNYEERIRAAVESRQRAITDLNRRHDDEVDALRRTIDRLRDDLRLTDRRLINAEDHIKRLERRRHSPPPSSQKRRRSRSPTPLPRAPLVDRIQSTPRSARLEDRITSRSPIARSPSPNMNVDEPATLVMPPSGPGKRPNPVRTELDRRSGSGPGSVRPGGPTVRSAVRAVRQAARTRFEPNRTADRSSK